MLGAADHHGGVGVTVPQKIAATSALLLVISWFLSKTCKEEPTYGADENWKIFVGLLMVVSLIALICSIITLIWSVP